MHHQRIKARFVVMLTVTILLATVLPFGMVRAWADQQQIELAAGSSITVTCTTELSGVIEGQQAKLVCKPQATATAQPAVQAQPSGQSVAIFGDALADGWQNWSWNTTIDAPSKRAPHSGSVAIDVTFTGAWAGLYIHRDAGLSTNGFDTLRFFINGNEKGNQRIRLCTATNCKNGSSDLTVQAGSWMQVDVPLSTFGSPAAINDLIWQDVTGNAQPTFSIDDIALVRAGSTAPRPQPTVQPQQPTAQPQQPTVQPQQPTVQPQQPTVQPQQPTAQPSNGRTFLETFDGAPDRPTPWNPANWDVSVHGRDANIWEQLPSMQAHHGTDCSASPATHEIHTYADSVFQCKNHVMMAINGGNYGMIYLTPNQQVDFSNGEAVVQFDLSTERSSDRDWFDFWITPYDENLVMPLENWRPDGQGAPRHGIHFLMEGPGSNSKQAAFRGYVMRDFAATELPNKGYVTMDKVLVPSSVRRDTFELRISRTHIKFGMPQYNLWWVDTDVADLGWSSGVLQLGQHSYNPSKDGPDMLPNTWHLDNVRIEPATSFTMVKALQENAKPSSPTVQLAAPAPANGKLRFSGNGQNLQVSFDGGKSWQAAQVQQQERKQSDLFMNYWMPIPQGTTQISFRGEGLFGHTWFARSIAVWSK